MTDSTHTMALITGASSGIGAALARHMAGHGHDLVLVARDAARLNALAAELKGSHGRRIETMALNLTLPEAPAALYQELARRNCSPEILVNNAGFGVHGAFGATDVEAELRMIDLQLKTTVALTKLFVAEALPRGHGRILNVASLYSFCPVPFQAVYGACKAFLLNFSDALALELKSHGISVTVVCPGAVRTEFRTRAGVAEQRPDAGMPPELVAQQAYAALMRGDALVVPGTANRIFATATRMLPGRIGAAAIRRINRLRGVGETHLP